MKFASKFEGDLLAKFMDAAQSTMPGITMAYVEKYKYDSDTYLRIGLDLPKDVDADSPDIELIQKLASSVPLHPQYQISLAFSVPSDSDHELVLDFLPRKYLSQKSWVKTSLARKLYILIFKQRYVTGIWPFVVVPVIAILVVYFAFVYGAQPYMILSNAAAATERKFNASYFSIAEIMRSDPAQANLRLKGREFTDALNQYNKALDAKSNSETRILLEDAQIHVQQLKRVVDVDPFVDAAGGKGN